MWYVTEEYIIPFNYSDAANTYIQMDTVVTAVLLNSGCIFQLNSRFLSVKFDAAENCLD